MHESIWSERGFAGVAGVDKPARAVANRHGVVRAELHKQIVRVLSIDERLALVTFTRLKKQRRAARGKREGLSAEHGAELECARTGAADGGRHKPVFRLEFRDAAWATLAVD